MSKPSTQASPIVAVGAVIWRGQEVLLIRRARHPRLGEWSIPGGKVALGESLREALAREVREETGLEIDILGLIDVVDFFAAAEGGRASEHYVLVDYSARWNKGEPRAGSDAGEARWVPHSALDRYEMWGETRRVIAMSARAMGLTE